MASNAAKLLAKKRELLAQKAKAKTYPKFEIDKVLFKEQLDFVQDPARYALACCSVRSGKTTAAAVDLISTALTMPGTTGLYITLARSSGKRIIWPELLRINRDYGLGANINIAELYPLTFASKAQ